MSCDVAAAAFMMLASFSPQNTAQPALIPVASAPAAPPSVADEPLFKDIVGRAGVLKSQVETYRGAVGQSAAPLAPIAFDAFAADIAQLSALDEQGHVTLLQRGAPDDLKCILHGISQDLMVKLTAVKVAKTGHDQDLALRDMQYLLRDNVEVITAPPQPPA